MGGKPSSLYNAAVEASSEYLGPAGERFMRRQITMHLGIEPERITPRELDELIKWVKLAFALLTNDKTHVEAFVQNLEQLAKQSANGGRAGYGAK